MVTEAQMDAHKLDAFRRDEARCARDLSQPGLSDHLGVVRSALLRRVREGGLVGA